VHFLHIPQTVESKVHRQRKRLASSVVLDEDSHLKLLEHFVLQEVLIEVTVDLVCMSESRDLFSLVIIHIFRGTFQF